ncbi:hypothetical protein SAMN05216404_106144 [Nitrosospira multiformis]|uniref:DUF6950 domain-containing protein n=1 Tax=Nitrosospira multiformis TaxID=1231 RepID=A0A1H8IQJ1_9PROT|nr:hypothetical protein [Nitrosospira multiformis]SEN70651.1 hypothetical protein SAMN05216404_106144 [Nitrosospira multiformis]
MKFSEYISSHANRRFIWGVHDCCTFVGEWVRLETGRDYLTEHRPWTTAREAKKKLRDLNGLSFFLDQHFKRIPPGMAQDGDLTIYQGAACLFSGRHIVSVGETGLVFTDRSVAKEAWTCRH